MTAKSLRSVSEHLYVNHLVQQKSVTLIIRQLCFVSAHPKTCDSVVPIATF